jgi:hypothetical protein
MTSIYTIGGLLGTTSGNILGTWKNIWRLDGNMFGKVKKIPPQSFNPKKKNWALLSACCGFLFPTLKVLKLFVTIFRLG